MTAKTDQLGITQIAGRIGVPADPAAIRATLDLLWTDVIGENDVDDGHVRFGEHIGMLAFAGDRWPDLQERMDTMKWNDWAGANALERAAIRRIITQVLGQ